MKHLADLDASAYFRTDTMSLFLLKDAICAPEPSIEIAEVSEFQTDQLPQDTSPLTRIRLAELTQDMTAASAW